MTGREHINTFLSDRISLPPSLWYYSVAAGRPSVGKATGLFGAVQQNPLAGGIFGQNTTTSGAGLFGSTTTSATSAQPGTLFEGGTLGYPQNQQTTGFNGRKLI